VWVVDQPRLSLLLAALIFLAACAPKLFRPTPTSDEFPERSRQDLEATVFKRAQFDLNCPAEQMTYKVLGPEDLGVEGCGKRAAYKRVAGTGWVLNSVPTQDEASAPSP
jgi:hypothetical protein